MESESRRIARYVDDVLFHPERAHLDVSTLSEENRKLGEGIVCLGTWAIEANAQAEALARREWDCAPGDTGGNVFAGSIEKIRVMLLNMTKQLKDIVEPAAQQEGQDPETVPDDFSGMVRELRRRTSALENERNLFIQFTESASERIVVLDERTGDMLFGNKVAREFHETNREYVDDAHTLNAQSACSSANPYSEWLHKVVRPVADGTVRTEYYEVHSLYIIWENKGAIAHMFSDVTDLVEAQDLASRDSLTGLRNRAFAMGYLEKQAGLGEGAAVAFVDVDYLKYCNDSLGHASGDGYLRQVAELLKGVPCAREVCRTGGDEFLVIARAADAEALAAELGRARQELVAEPFCEEPGSPCKSFSFGIAACGEPGAADVSAMLALADERMYRNKLQNKRENHASYVDDRL